MVCRAVAGRVGPAYAGRGCVGVVAVNGYARVALGRAARGRWDGDDARRQRRYDQGTQQDELIMRYVAGIVVVLVALCLLKEAWEVWPIDDAQLRAITTLSTPEAYRLVKRS